MPSPQKAVVRPEQRDVDSDSDSECEGLLERDFDGVNALEGMLMSEIFDHLTSLGGLSKIYQILMSNVSFSAYTI